MIASSCHENLTARLYQEYSAKVHKEKLARIKSRNLSLNLSQNPKRRDLEKPKSFLNIAKMNEVIRENKVLFDRLTEISERKTQEDGKGQSSSPRTLNFVNRKKDAELIIKQNNSFIKRLLEKPSQISIKQLRMDYETQQKYKENLSKRKILDRIERIVKQHPMNGLSSAKSKQEISVESRKVKESDQEISN